MQYNNNNNSNNIFFYNLCYNLNLSPLWYMNTLLPFQHLRYMRNRVCSFVNYHENWHGGDSM